MDVATIMSKPQAGTASLGRNQQTEREPIPGTPYVQITQRDEAGRLIGIAVDQHVYVESAAGALVFDQGFVEMHTTMNSIGMLRYVKTTATGRNITNWMTGICRWSSTACGFSAIPKTG